MHDEVAYEVLHKVHDFLGILIRENLIKEAPFLDEEPMLMVSDLADDLYEVIQKGLTYNNAAKMRETLEQIDRIVWDKCRHTKEETEAHRLATEALSAPARNCDRPLIVDGPADNVADRAWIAFKRCNPNAYFDVSGLLRCIYWLFSEKKEEAK